MLSSFSHSQDPQRAELELEQPGRCSNLHRGPGRPRATPKVRGRERKGKIKEGLSPSSDRGGMGLSKLAGQCQELELVS